MIILVGVLYSAMVGFFCGVFRDSDSYATERQAYILK